MRFWIFMVIMTLLIPAALIMTWHACPNHKKINRTVGYRTSRAIKNQETWYFAQMYCAKVSFYLFFPALLLSIIVMPFFLNKSSDEIGWAGFCITLVQMMSFIFIVVLTERALKKNFDSQGNRL